MVYRHPTVWAVLRLRQVFRRTAYRCLSDQFFIRVFETESVLGKPPFKSGYFHSFVSTLRVDEKAPFMCVRVGGIPPRVRIQSLKVLCSATVPTVATVSAIVVATSGSARVGGRPAAAEAGTVDPTGPRPEEATGLRRDVVETCRRRAPEPEIETVIGVVAGVEAVAPSSFVGP